MQKTWIVGWHKKSIPSTKSNSLGSDGKKRVMKQIQQINKAHIFSCRKREH